MGTDGPAGWADKCPSAFSCLARLASSSPGHTPPHLLPALLQRRRQWQSSLIPLWPSHPPLSLLPSFPAIISLVRNEPQRWSPTAAPSWSLCWAAVGTMAVTGEGHRVEGKLEAQLPPGRATIATVLRGLDTLNPRWSDFCCSLSQGCIPSAA